MHKKTTQPCGGPTFPPPPPHQKLIHPKNDVVFPPILQPYQIPHDPQRHRFASAISPPPFTLTSVISAAVSWLRNRRIRYLFLLLCSPLLLVFLLVAFPFLCATELCLRRRLWRKLLYGFSGEDSGDRLRRCEEGCCQLEDQNEEEKGLLHRYLEDQLFLVRSMYECGDDEEQEEFDEEDSRRVEQNLDCSKVPLLLR
ncbi:uncharacterized protein [Cicer arietinum]|uniref:Uncharacterized protein LOC101496768 n=1 Tax=Cicer arietinum TaxID=3827 RepID=A0A1S2Y621_CICAR|nr:uncharacterized protein LOC101496768 [Cicer arietinum]